MCALNKIHRLGKGKHKLKNILGISLLSVTMGFGTAQADDAKTTNVDVKRKVVRVVVKDKPVNAEYSKIDRRHLIRVYGSQTASGKVIKPKQTSEQMPNLFVVKPR